METRRAPQWDVSFDPSEFDEALKLFRARVPMLPEDFYKLSAAARNGAWTISGLAQVELIREVQESLERALRDGTPFEDWQKQIRGRLEAAWGGTVKSPGARIELIFRNAAQHAYSHGRLQQMAHPDVARLRPFRQFDAILDDRTSDVCAACNGTVLPADDPWWESRIPPLHHSCRSGIRSLRRSQAEAQGITTTKPFQTASKGFGAPPKLDSPEIEKQVEKVVATLPEPIQQVAKEKATKKPKPVQRPKVPPEHRWESWVGEYESRGYDREVAEALAKARAEQEKALDLPMAEVLKEFDALAAEGSPLARQGGMRRSELEEWARQGATLRKVEAKQPGAEKRAVAAVIGHRRSVERDPRSVEVAPIAVKPGDDAARAQGIYDETVAFYRSMGSKRLRHPGKDWVFSYAPNERAFCDDRARLMLFDRRDTTLSHEWGHALEALNPSLARRALSFLRSRTRGEALQALARLQPFAGYRPSELTRPDEFTNPYIGKDYGSAGYTEVTSMAVEYLFSGSWQWLIARKDPDLLLFVLSQLADR